jgi:hypothetical protein
VSEIEYTADPFVNCAVWSILTCGVAEVRLSKKRIPSPQITNHRVLLLLSGASLEEKSPVTFGSVGIPSIVYMVTQHTVHSARTEREEVCIVRVTVDCFI